jgi:Cys-tRNA(Pro)/Cys-tRNA(Cys) deacylase
MTPAVKLAMRSGIVFTLHEYTHDPACQSYGMEAAEKLGVPPGQVFKTLVVQRDNRQLLVAVLPVSSTLSMKRIASATGAKKANLANQADVQRSTGYVLGGVSPLGQKKRLPTVIDSTALQYPEIYVSAGKRGLDIALAPADLAGLLEGSFADISTDHDHSTDGADEVKP